MKRETFEIKANGAAVERRYAWNASIRSIERLAGEIAKAEGVDYSLIDSHSEKEGFGHVRGYRVWQGSNGNTIKFEIEKVKP